MNPDINELVSLIYEAPLQPERWTDFLGAFSTVIRAEASAIFGQDHDSSQAFVAASHGFDPDYQRSYNTYYAGVNVWLKRLSGQTKSGDLRNSVQACSDGELVRTEYYNDWLRPQKLYYGYGGTILRESDFTTNITAVRTKKQGPFDAAEMELLALLMPHLQRAIQLHRRLASTDAARGLLLDALDNLTTGVFLVGPKARLLYMNHSAQQIVDQHDGVSVDANNLHLASSRETARLRRLVPTSLTLDLESGPGRAGGEMRATRPSGRPAFVMVVIPVRPERAEVRVLMGLEQPTAIILVSDPEKDPEADCGLIQRCFALTPAESRLASLLIAGKSVKEISASMGVTVNTARTHLKRVLSKTGTRRQGELIQLLMKTVGQIQR